MSEFKYFRNTMTGKVGLYPEDFGDLFYDTFVEVDSSAADCVDCWIKPEDEVLDEDFEVEFLGEPDNFDDNDDDEFRESDDTFSNDNNEDK
jgi:hypothetical protein